VAFRAPSGKAEWATLGWRIAVAVSLTVVGVGQAAVGQSTTISAAKCAEVAGVVTADGTARAVTATVQALRGSP